MRTELARLLRHRWWEDGGMFEVHVKTIVAMGLQGQEKQELVAMLEECTDSDQYTIMTEVMSRSPAPVFREPLIEGLSSESHETRRDAAMALLAGRYEGAAELVLTQPLLIEDMGAELPWLVTEKKLELTDEVRAQLLNACRQHFGGRAAGGSFDSLWLWMLRALRATDDQTAQLLVDLWKKLTGKQTDARYELLTAMAGAAHPLYRPIFQDAAKSSVVDLRKAALVGLNRLDRLKDGSTAEEE